jgi:2-hydroxy-3-oxopropionate reductase
MEKIGFIGLGIMGKPMALHLIKAGYSLTVLSSSKAVEELKKAGAQTAGTPAEIGSACDIVITIVPDSPDVEHVVLGKNGVAEGIKKGAMFIDMSTIASAVSIKIADKLREKGVESLDAPVSGGQSGAEAGTLSIMVGGSESAFQRALPVFEKMGKNIVHIGAPGAGQVTKACNQIVVAMTIQAVAEAMTLAKKSGVDIGKVRSALLGGFAQSKILDLYGQRIIDRNFKPGFRVNLHRKDMNIVLQLGKQQSVPLYGSALVAAQMDALIAQGHGEMDNSSLALLLEQLSGISQ